MGGSSSHPVIDQLISQQSVPVSHHNSQYASVNHRDETSFVYYNEKLLNSSNVFFTPNNLVAGNQTSPDKKTFRIKYSSGTRKVAIGGAMNSKTENLGSQEHSVGKQVINKGSSSSKTSFTIINNHYTKKINR
jgi:hypothetical protein